MYIINLLLNQTTYFTIFFLNYVFTLCIISTLLEKAEKFKTITDMSVFFYKNNLNIIFLLVLFNLIGLPPFPSFFLKINLMFNILQNYSIFVYTLVVFFNIFIFFFYSNILNFFNISSRSKKYYYNNRYPSHFIKVFIYFSSIILISLFNPFFFILL